LGFIFCFWESITKKANEQGAFMSNGANLPLAINLVGPMLLQQNGNMLEVWLPNLSTSSFPHEVGVATNIDSIKLNPGEYSLTGQTPSSAQPFPYYLPASSELLSLNKKTPPTKYIHISLSAPKLIVGLSPEPCFMIYNGVSESSPTLRATGARLLYEETGIPVLQGTDSSGTNVRWQLPIDVSAQEHQVEVSINHHPVTHDTCPTHPEAKSDFKQMAMMVGIMNVAVDFPPSPPFFVGPAHDCITPIATIS
jgi:hypothetical protein